jgi:hypothetical protein
VRIAPDWIRHELATIIDAHLAEQLVSSYIKMQQRYFAGDWGPAELNGGQFCEVIARAFYQLDRALIPTNRSGWKEEGKTSKTA